MAENDQQYEGYPREITGLRVSAAQSYVLELSDSHTMSTKRRAKVKAAVDVGTGEVRFYVEPQDIAKLMPKKQLEPGS